MATPTFEGGQEISLVGQSCDQLKSLSLCNRREQMGQMEISAESLAISQAWDTWISTLFFLGVKFCDVSNI